MSIKFKAQKRNISFQKGVDKYAYVQLADLFSKLSQTKIINEASLRSGISKGGINKGGISRGAINVACDAPGEVFKAWTTSVEDVRQELDRVAVP